jgi:hypothetical protein
MWSCLVEWVDSTSPKREVGESGKLEGKEEKREEEGEIYGVPVPPSPTSTSLNCGTFSGACCCPGSACT